MNTKGFLPVRKGQTKPLLGGNSGVVQDCARRSPGKEVSLGIHSPVRKPLRNKVTCWSGQICQYRSGKSKDQQAKLAGDKNGLFGKFGIRSCLVVQRAMELEMGKVQAMFLCRSRDRFDLGNNQLS